MMEVSVIIVCMNRVDNLIPCLESLYKYNIEIEFETLVVAYLFDKGELARLRESFPEVVFIENDKISGFSENNNIALRQARGRFCFILNDDTEIFGPVLRKLVDDFDMLPDNAAIITPRLLNVDGSLQLCGRPDYPAWNYVKQQWHCFKEPIDNVRNLTPVFDKVYSTFNISGAAFLIKTEIFRKLGFFDERYFFTPEDIALSTAARKKGFGVYVDAGTSVTHKWRTTASRIMGATRPSAVRGSLIFFSEDKKWKYLLLGTAVWCAEMSKRLKAWALAVIMPSDTNLTQLKTYKNITRSIFTHKSPKDIFCKYYKELRP